MCHLSTMKLLMLMDWRERWQANGRKLLSRLIQPVAQSPLAAQRGSVRFYSRGNRKSGCHESKGTPKTEISR